MKTWQTLGLVGGAAVVALFYMGRKKSPEMIRAPWRLHFEVDSDRRAQVVLSVLEEHGRSAELELFDGKNLYVLWIPDAAYEKGNVSAARDIFLALDGAAGVNFISADEQLGQGPQAWEG